MASFASVNGVTIHYELTGDPARKPALVFANSLGTDFRIWRAIVPAFANDFAILCYDKRGHGLSDIAHPPYAMSDHVGDIAGLLDHLHIRRAVMCGLSVGGMIAIGLTSWRPDLVRALILCDTAHKIGTADSWNDRIRAITENGIPAVSGTILERWFSPAFRSPSNASFAGYRNMLERSPVTGYAGTCAALRDTDYTAKARVIHLPTLCVVGDQDGATPPALVKELADLIAGARYEIIADAGHIPCVEQPDKLISVMRPFLASVGS